MSVAFPVVGNFGIPEFLVTAGALVALRAAVPKTAVHEHNNPFAPEGEIRLAEKRLVAPPAGDAVLAKYSWWLHLVLVSVPIRLGGSGMPF